MLKPFPILTTDEEAEDFVANADLSEYDWRSLRRVQFESTPDEGISVHDAATGEPLYPKAVHTTVEAGAASVAPSDADDADERRRALAATPL